jgi:hypothetical protein
MIFAREVSDSLTSLVKKIDEATVKNASARMGSFVVFCSDDDGLKDKLKELAEKEHIKKTILTLDNPSGPSKYEVAKDADVTVIFYNEREVLVNKAFKKGELSAKDVDSLVAEIPKMIAAKKKEEKKDDKKKDDKKEEKKSDK